MQRISIWFSLLAANAVWDSDLDTNTDSDIDTDSDTDTDTDTIVQVC